MGSTFKERIDEIVNDAANAAARTTILFAVNGFIELYSNVIDDYYASYSPHLYNRKYEMYDLLNFDIPDDGVSVRMSFDETIMKYRNDTPTSGTYDGLYWYAFHKGWHGGAATGPNHPGEGTPYWRDVKTGYRTWLKEAFQSESPYDRVMSEWKTFWYNTVSVVFNDELNKEISLRERDMQLALLGDLTNG